MRAPSHLHLVSSPSSSICSSSAAPVRTSGSSSAEGKQCTKQTVGPVKKRSGGNTGETQNCPDGRPAAPSSSPENERPPGHVHAQFLASSRCFPPRSATSGPPAGGTRTCELWCVPFGGGEGGVDDNRDKGTREEKGQRREQGRDWKGRRRTKAAGTERQHAALCPRAPPSQEGPGSWVEWSCPGFPPAPQRGYFPLGEG